MWSGRGRHITRGVVLIVAVRREEIRADAADERAEEWQTGTYYRDVAFGCSPVGCANVAPCLFLLV